MPPFTETTHPDPGFGTRSLVAAMLLQMLPPIHCPVSTAGLAISAVQCLNILSFANEKQTPTGYSKFADKATATIPSRTGMLVIYVPALVTAGAMLATAPQVNGREALVAGMTLTHFAKRVVEGFTALAEADPLRWVVVDGGGSVDEVAAKVSKAVGLR